MILELYLIGKNLSIKVKMKRSGLNSPLIKISKLISEKILCVITFFLK